MGVDVEMSDKIIEKWAMTFIDESGNHMFVRNLKEWHDNEIALLCALCIPEERVEFFRNRIKPFYDRLKSIALKKGIKMHVTDFFSSDDMQLRDEAINVRKEVFNLIKKHQPAIVYSARRVRLARVLFEKCNKERIRAYENSIGTNIRVSELGRISQENIMQRVMTFLICQLDECLRNFSFSHNKLCFDEIDGVFLKIYKDVVKELICARDFSHFVKFRNIKENKTYIKTLKGKIITDRIIEDTLVKDMEIIGKDDPIIFAIDITCNSLWRHLSSLPKDAMLNNPYSIKGWELENVTFTDPRRIIFPPSVDVV